MKLKKIFLLTFTTILLIGCSSNDQPSSLSTKSSSAISSSSLSSSSSSSSSRTSTGPKPIEKEKLEHNVGEYFKNSIYNNNGQAVSCSPSKGNVKALIIPVWFNDSDLFISNDKKENVKSDIENAFNASSTSLGWYSVSSFYEQESLGQLHLTAVVSDWYAVSKSYTYYGNGSSSYVCSLVNAASNWYFSETEADRTEFDVDGDGFLDSVTLIYGAPDYASLDDRSVSNLWAYTTWIGKESARSVTSPGANVLMWASYDFMYNSETAYDRAGSSYGFGDSRFTSVDAHTYIHEFGHVLGLEDYYDYSYQYKPAAGFSMQDHNVGGHDPFSTLEFQWSEVYKPLESTTITIKDFQSSHDLILIGNHNVTSVFDEYFLLELYTPTLLNELDSTENYSGYYPLGPTIPGIRLWHVDARLLYSRSGEINERQITTNPKYSKATYGVHYVQSNSYDGDYASLFGKNYYDFNLQQLIRNDVNATYRPTDIINNTSLFVKNDEFSISNYQSQFKKGTKLNDGKDFYWSFKVTNVDESSATIKLTYNK